MNKSNMATDTGKVGHTPGPWFMSGVRFRMNGGEWHNINHYDESLKEDKHVACVGYDPRTGVGLADARLIAAAPDLYEALKAVVADILEYERVNNLSPNPGREYCWDSVARAQAVITKITIASPVVTAAPCPPTGEARGD